MRLVYLILLTVSCACAQVDGILTQVSRNVSITVDESDFAIAATAGLDVTAEQVIQILQTAGLQNLSLTGSGVGQTYDYSSGESQLVTQTYYQFNTSAAASAIKDVAKKLEALRTNLPDTLKGLQFSAYTTSSQATVDAARQATLPLLLADAQKKGQALAMAAGVKLGAIKSIGEFGSSVGGVGLPSPMMITTGTYGYGYGSGAQYTFSVSVTFALAP